MSSVVQNVYPNHQWSPFVVLLVFDLFVCFFTQLRTRPTKTKNIYVKVIKVLYVL